MALVFQVINEVQAHYTLERTKATNGMWNALWSLSRHVNINQQALKLSNIS